MQKQRSADLTFFCIYMYAESMFSHGMVHLCLYNTSFYTSNFKHLGIPPAAFEQTRVEHGLKSRRQTFHDEADIEKTAWCNGLILYVHVCPFFLVRHLFEPCHEKTCFMHICQNKDTDQLHDYRTANQRLCFSLHILNKKKKRHMHI